MKIRVCSKCGAHNPLDVWNCARCGVTLGVHTINELDNALVEVQVEEARVATAKKEPTPNTRPVAKSELHLPQGRRRAKPTARKRPGCLGVYAVLLCLVAAGGLIGSIVMFLGSPLSQGFWACVYAPMAMLPFAIGYGLWQMKMWAWWLVIIGQALSIVVALVENSSNGGALNIFITIVVSTGIILWFINIRQQFANDHIAVEPSGARYTARYVLSFIVITGVVTAAAFAALALLSP
jgi:hypothetical protein